MNLLSSVRLRIVLNVDADPVIYLSAVTDPYLAIYLRAATDPDPAIYRNAVADPDPAFAITLEVKILHFFWHFSKFHHFYLIITYCIYE
jgi:hypothetical protein